MKKERKEITFVSPIYKKTRRTPRETSIEMNVKEFGNIPVNAFAIDLHGIQNELYKILMSDIFKGKKEVYINEKLIYQFNLYDIASKLYRTEKPTSRQCNRTLIAILELKRTLFTFPYPEYIEYLDEQISRYIKQDKTKEIEQLENQKYKIMETKLEGNMNRVRSFVEDLSVQKGVHLEYCNDNTIINIKGTPLKKININMSLPMDIWELTPNTIDLDYSELKQIATKRNGSELEYKVKEIILDNSIGKTKLFKMEYETILRIIPIKFISEKLKNRPRQLKKKIFEIATDFFPDIDIVKSKTNGTDMLFFNPRKLTEYSDNTDMDGCCSYGETSRRIESKMKGYC